MWGENSATNPSLFTPLKIRIVRYKSPSGYERSLSTMYLKDKRLLINQSKFLQTEKFLRRA